MRTSLRVAAILLALAAAGRAEVYLSADCGKTWEARGPKDFEVLQLVPDPKAPAVAWAIARPTVAKEGEDLRFASTVVMRTEDSGKAWAAVESYKGPDPFCIEVDPEDSQVVYVGATFGRIEKSSDGGKTWALINLKDATRNADGSPAAPQHGVVLVRARGHRVIASGRAFGDSALASGRVKSDTTGFSALSTDSGKTWTVLRNEAAGAAALAGGRVFLADVYGNADVSADDGKTWTVVRKLKDTEMYPFTGHGVFSVSPDGKEVVYSCLGQTASSTDGGDWKAWPWKSETCYAEWVAWCRPQRLAIFQHGERDERREHLFREVGARSLRICDVSGEWVPISVPGEKSPLRLSTACDGSAAWLIAKEP